MVRKRMRALRGISRSWYGYRFVAGSLIVQVVPPGVKARRKGQKMTALLEMKKAPVLEDYFGMSDAELHERIEAARREMGEQLVILGHHYQRDDVISHADYTGDSFKLAQLAASRPEAEFIVFC